jgi:hypothetical protein
MNPRNKSFWMPIVVGIPIAILINLVTQLLDVQSSVAIFAVTLIIAVYFLLSDKIANWLAERSRQSRAKAARQLEQELNELENLRGDLPSLVSRIAWDLLLFQMTVAMAVLIAMIIGFALPITVGIRPYVIGVFIGFIFTLFNQLKELRYIRRVYDFGTYRDEVKAKLAKFTESEWSELLVSGRWTLVHNPPNQSKPITFLRGGKVSEGQNQNEHTWRTHFGKLELLQEDGRVHSRFDFDKKSIKFVHTNDPDTLSGRDQYIYRS